MEAKMDQRQEAKREALLESGTFNSSFERVGDELFLDNEFFDARDLMQVKYEMLRRVLQEGMPAARAAGLFGFSRTTFYETLATFQKGGLCGLIPDRPGPKGAHKLTLEVMGLLEKAVAQRPSLRPAEMREFLQAKLHLSVHPRSIERALARRKKGV
jgi:transposase